MPKSTFPKGWIRKGIVQWVKNKKHILERRLGYPWPPLYLPIQGIYKYIYVWVVVKGLNRSRGLWLYSAANVTVHHIHIHKQQCHISVHVIVIPSTVQWRVHLWLDITAPLYHMPSFKRKTQFNKWVSEYAT